jgi:hypothetical protein
MHDHDNDTAARGDAPRRGREPDAMVVPHQVGLAIEARRPDTLGAPAVLHLQRTAGNASVGALVSSDEAESPVKDVVRSHGAPLDTVTRSSMEATLGHEFGDVRVHTDARAAASADSVQAQAYTVGDHIVFGAGTYQPDTAQGQRTLAHELTHVVQQRSGPVDGTPAPGGISLSHPSDRFEQEAERVSASVVPAASAVAPLEVAAPAVQRDVEIGAGATAAVQREDASGPAIEEEPDDGAPAPLEAQRQEAGGEEQEEPEAP